MAKEPAPRRVNTARGIGARETEYKARLSTSADARIALITRSGGRVTYAKGRAMTCTTLAMTKKITAPASMRSGNDSPSVSNFRTTTGTQLGTGKAVTDFSFAVSYGFGYNLQSRLQLFLVQEYGVMIHKRQTGNPNNSAQQQTIRVGARLGLGDRH